jgi:hypothetical protein
LLICSLTVILSAIGPVVLTAVANWPSNRVVWQTCQPGDINYESFDPYCLSVIEGSLDWQSSLFSPPRRYRLFVGRGTEAPGYGYEVEYSFPLAPRDDPDGYIRESKVQWTKEGVTFEEPSGQRLFIPKRLFIAGR